MSDLYETGKMVRRRLAELRVGCGPRVPTARADGPLAALSEFEDERSRYGPALILLGNGIEERDDQKVHDAAEHLAHVSRVLLLESTEGQS